MESTVVISIVFIAYAVVILSLAVLKTGNKVFKSLIRKAVHLFTGLVIFILTYHISKDALGILIIAGTVFAFLTYFIKRLNYIHTTSETSLGTLFYPVGILLSFMLLYSMPLHYFRISLLLLAISDVAANLGGYITAWNRRFVVLSEEKSLWGVTGFIITAFLIAFYSLPGEGCNSLSFIILLVITGVNCEIISFKGSDNLTVPLGSAFLFYNIHGMSQDFSLVNVLIIMVALGAVILYRKGSLTRYGAIAVYILGLYFFIFLGFQWSIPVVFFFLTSVLFTRINSQVHGKEDVIGGRNIWQVFANVFFAVLSTALFQLTGSDLYIYLYITLIASVTADTWASEIGPVFNKRCFSIYHWAVRGSGVSGGISPSGTLAALTGSFIISAMSFYLFFGTLDHQLVLLLTLSGFAASFVDSLMGAYAEPVMERMDFFIIRAGSERPSPNDVINLFASLSAPFFFLLFQIIFG